MFTIGIDLGGTKIAAGIVDNSGKILKTASTRTLRGRDYREIVQDMAGLVKSLVEDFNEGISCIQYIGIGSPGVVNPENGNILFSGNLGFKKAPIINEFKSHIDIPLYIENDANCAALAESYHGAAKDTESSITVTFGTGIGGGYIINGSIQSGHNYAGGEFGHATIVVDGEPCTCGRKGCWEAYASATALIRQAGKAAANNRDSTLSKMVNNDYSKINGKIVFDAAQGGDMVAKGVLNKYFLYISEGVTNLINMLQPEVVVIGGGISRQKQNLIEPIQKLVNERVFIKEGIKNSEIRVAQMGNEAGIVGAALLGKQICVSETIKVF